METLGHITQNCFHSQGARIKRHDNIVKYVAGQLIKKGRQVVVEPEYKSALETFVPDLVIRRGTQRVAHKVWSPQSATVLTDLGLGAGDI